MDVSTHNEPLNKRISQKMAATRKNGIVVQKWRSFVTTCTGGSAIKTTALPIIGMDIAKNVFQLHIVDPETGEIERLKLKRDRVVAFFANRQPSPSLVAAEACGGAHHWGRALQSQGHQVKLLRPKQVRSFVSRDKTDARDAQAIWVAAQQPHIFEVPVKSEQQQACLTLHRMRAQLMKIRIMQTNALRGLLYEFGIVLPEGHRILLNRIQRELAKVTDKLPAVITESVLEQPVLTDCKKTSTTLTNAW